MESESSLFKTGVFCAYSRRFRDLSTSGGVCAELADLVISKGGIVFGAVYSQDFRSVRTIGIDNMNDYFRLVSKSKYSECANPDFDQILGLLLKGKLVLFIGCPCQIKDFLGYSEKRFENLITVDMHCHGYCKKDRLVEFIDVLEHCHGHKIISLDMRHMHKVQLRAVFDDGSVYSDNSVHKIFINSENLIEKCKSCNMKYSNNKSDITVGDFWEYSRHRDFVGEDFSPNIGTNLVKINTTHGFDVFNLLKPKLEFKEVFQT